MILKSRLWPACGMVLCRTYLGILEAVTAIIGTSFAGEMKEIVMVTRSSQKHYHVPKMCGCGHVCRGGRSLRNGKEKQQLTLRVALPVWHLVCLCSSALPCLFFQQRTLGSFLHILSTFRYRPCQQKPYSSIKNCMHHNSWDKKMIPVGELISLWACLGKQLLILSKTLPCFPHTGQGEARLSKATERFNICIFCPHAGSQGRRRGVKISGMRMWCVTSHQEVKLWFYNLWQYVRKIATPWKLRQHYSHHLPLVVFAKTCYNIGIYELIHLPFVYLMQIYQIRYIYKSTSQNMHVKFDMHTNLSKLRYTNMWTFECNVFSKYK